MLDLLIIGAGPIGLFAAFNAGLRNFNAALVEAQSYVGGQLTTIYADKPIYDMPGIKEIRASDFANMLYEQYLPFQDRVPLYLNTKFFEIINKGDHFEVRTATKTFHSKTVLLTVGNGNFNPRKLRVPESDQYENIIYFVKDVKNYVNQDIIVLGGGDSAFDWANLLAKNNKSVSLIHRRNEFRAQDESVSTFKEQGSIYTPYVVDSLIAKNEKEIKEIVIKNLEDDSLKTLPVDTLIVNFGFLPSLIKYDNFNLNYDDQGLFVKQDMSTSQDGIYAAGNCVTYHGKLKTIASGFGEAATAIHAINNFLFPGKSNIIFSSALIQKKK